MLMRYFNVIDTTSETEFSHQTCYISIEKDQNVMHI